MCQYGNIGPLRIFARQRILDSPRVPIGEYIKRAVFFGCILRIGIDHSIIVQPVQRQQLPFASERQRILEGGQSMVAGSGGHIELHLVARAVACIVVGFDENIVLHIFLYHEHIVGGGFVEPVVHRFEKGSVLFLYRDIEGTYVGCYGHNLIGRRCIAVINSLFRIDLKCELVLPVYQRDGVVDRLCQRWQCCGTQNSGNQMLLHTRRVLLVYLHTRLPAFNGNPRCFYFQFIN